MTAGRPRILHVITSLAIGGAQNHLLTVLRGLGDKYQFDVAYFKDPDLVADVSDRADRVNFFDLGGVPSPLELWRFARHIARGRYGVVHTHLLKADMWGAVIRSVGRGPPVLSTKHNAEGPLLNPAYGRIHGVLTRSADTVIAVSSSVVEYMTTAGRVAGPKMVVVHYGIEDVREPDPDAVMRARIGFGIGMNDPFVLCVARLDPQKGHDTLIRAWKSVSAHLPSARLVLAGGTQLGGDDFAQGLKHLASSLGIADKVIFAGVRRDATDLIAACNVLAMSSRWEGFGIVFLEAMRAGRPVVATRVGGISEVVAEGETGFLVRPDDPQDLASALIRLLDDRNMAEDMGDQGRLRFEQRFMAEQMLGKIADIYDRILNA